MFLGKRLARGWFRGLFRRETVHAPRRGIVKNKGPSFSSARVVVECCGVGGVVWIGAVVRRIEAGLPVEGLSPYREWDGSLRRLLGGRDKPSSAMLGPETEGE